jgi:hypothetical protein
MDFEPLFEAPDFEPLFFDAPDFEPDLLVDFFDAPPADFAALFMPPFEPDFDAPDRPFFDELPDREAAEPLEDLPLVVLLLAFAGGEDVLESPMTLPAASFMRLMADPAASVTLWAAPVIRFLATSPSLGVRRASLRVTRPSWLTGSRACQVLSHSSP